jgi:hypothetical protein
MVSCHFGADESAHVSSVLTCQIGALQLGAKTNRRKDKFQQRLNETKIERYIAEIQPTIFHKNYLRGMLTILNCTLSSLL